MSSKKEYTISKNIGLYDPNGLYNNPLTNEPYQNLYSDDIINKLPATGTEFPPNSTAYHYPSNLTKKLFLNLECNN